LCSISTACWSALLTGTNRMSGRDIASREAPPRRWRRSCPA
jgi:hypothetical protein